MIIVETTVSDETAFHANWVVTKVSLLSYFASQLKVTYALLQCYLIITRINIFFVIFVVINQINKHKAKIYNHYTYTQIINFFSLQSIRMNGNSINFDNNKNKKIFNIDDIDVNKILVSKKKHTVNIIHLNTLLGIMIMVLLDHYTYFFHKLLDTLINLIKIK